MCRPAAVRCPCTITMRQWATFYTLHRPHSRYDFGGYPRVVTRLQAHEVQCSCNLKGREGGTILLYVHRSEVAGLLGMGTGEGEGGRKSEGSTAETARKRPERPWTAARTIQVLRRCPLASAQRLVHCATAVSTAVLDTVTKTMSVALLLTIYVHRSEAAY